MFPLYAGSPSSLGLGFFQTNFRSWGVVQWLERLLNMHKALGYVPNMLHDWVWWCEPGSQQLGGSGVHCRPPIGREFGLHKTLSERRKEGRIIFALFAG